MNGPSDTGTIHDFLWGRPIGQNGADFLARLGNVSLRREFEKELAFEALFYSMSWNIQKTVGLATMADWASLAAPLSIVEKEHGPDNHTVLEWDRMVNGAFERAFPLRIVKSKSSGTIPFPKLFRYLAAACIVGAIAGITQLLPLPRVSEKVTGNVAHDTPTLSKKSAIAAKRENPPATSIVFDSIVIYGPRSITGQPILTETHDGIVRIGDRTAILLDKNSSVAVTSRSDSAVAINLNSGGALFTVEKHRFNRFSVSTPACEIRVTGTVFRLALESDMTIVSVLEGSVRAGIRHDSVMVSIGAGTSARIRPDTIMLENGDTAATLLYRSNILSDFLHENGVFENGMFVRSGIGKKNDTGAQCGRPIEQTIDKEQQRATDK